jgi:hypothetical protein
MFKIEEANREGAKIVLGLAGTSGDGKTYSALQLGYGLAGKSGKHLGFLDTENRRGRLYADILPERFQIADFEPPFSPDRYIDGIKAFEEKGCRVLVIDSVTHEWEGIGGCEEIATEGVVWPKPARWNVAKLHHKKFMNALLQSSMDVICCIRAREKVDMKNPKDIKSLGIQPICEKNFMFEMTASVLMQNEGRAQKVLKCPEALRKIMGRGNDYLTIQDGVDLRAWIDGGAPIDRELERVRSELKGACEWGMQTLESAWKGLSNDVRVKLKDELPALKASAEAYDRQAAIAKEANQEEGATA